MPLRRPLERLHRLTDRLPKWARYVAAVVLVLAALLIRQLANFVGWPAQGFPFLFFISAVGATATLGGGGAGYCATGLSVLLCLPFIPDSEAGPIRADWVLPVLVHVVLCCGITALVESLTHAVAERDAALAEQAAAIRRRALLLVEYRHRSRGDLQSISSLLRLRARYVADPSAQNALREAAAHTTALGRIHARLENARHDTDETAVVDSGCFVRGVCADLTPPICGVFAASRPLSTERSVALGLLLHELVADARQDGAAVVVVRLTALGSDFALDVIDDRPSLGATDGLRARLTDLLAGQLRGTLARSANVAGPGRSAAVRFPVLAPTLAPGAVGA